MKHRLRMSTDLPLMEYLEFARSLAVTAGGFILEALEKPTREMTSKSSSIDLVTETDKKCEDFILGQIQSKYPNHGILAEESFSAAGKAEYEFSSEHPTWVIDPIDGTNNFVHGYPFSCVCIGISMGKTPIVGVVHIPAAKETFYAVKGQGAFLNGSKICVSDIPSVEKAALATEFGYARAPEQVDLILGRLKKLMLHKVQSVRMAGAAALNLCNVAAGRLDVYYEGIDGAQGPKPWDLVAAGMILLEAGGVLYDLDGSAFDCTVGRVLAANSDKLAKEVIEIIR